MQPRWMGHATSLLLVVGTLAACAPDRPATAASSDRVVVELGAAHVAGAEQQVVETTAGQPLVLPLALDLDSIESVYIRTDERANIFLSLSALRVLAAGRVGLVIPPGVFDGVVTVYTADHRSVSVPFRVRRPGESGA